METSFDIFPSKSSIYPEVIAAFQKYLIVALNNGSRRKWKKSNKQTDKWTADILAVRSK